MRDAQADTPRHERLFGRLADQNTLASYESKDLIEVNDTEVTTILFHRQSMTSTCDSAESIATLPLEADLDDEQVKAMLASPLYQQERESSADQPLVYHSDRQNSVSSSSRFRASAGRPAALFSHKRKSSQESGPDREGISLAHRAVQGENVTVS